MLSPDNFINGMHRLLEKLMKMRHSYLDFYELVVYCRYTKADLLTNRCRIRSFDNDEKRFCRVKLKEHKIGVVNIKLRHIRIHNYAYTFMVSYMPVRTLKYFIQLMFAERDVKILQFVKYCD